MYYSKRYAETENYSVMDLPLDAFLSIYGDNVNTGICSNLCDSCKNIGCKLYDCAGELADVMEQDGYGNYYVAQCQCFKK